MTAKELIAYLSKLDHETEVVTMTPTGYNHLIYPLGKVDLSVNRKKHIVGTTKDDFDAIPGPVHGERKFRGKIVPGVVLY
jgi:hypothetical protein